MHGRPFPALSWACSPPSQSNGSASVRAELLRLREPERTVEDERRQRAYELDLLRQRTEAAERNAVVSETWTKVWGDAYNEAARTGHILPVSALLARAEVSLKAKGIESASLPS